MLGYPADALQRDLNARRQNAFISIVGHYNSVASLFSLNGIRRKWAENFPCERHQADPESGIKWLVLRKRLYEVGQLKLVGTQLCIQIWSENTSPR